MTDVYVTAPGTGIGMATPAFAGVDFRDETGYVGLNGGSYDVTVAIAGTQTAAIGPVTVDVVDGGVYTAVAGDAPGGGAPFTLTLLDELD